MKQSVQKKSSGIFKEKKMKYEDAVKKLSVYGQEHVLRFYETLDEGEKEAGGKEVIFRAHPSPSLVL